MKKYKNALCLMKAFPLHMGHLHLINTALEHSEIVHVVITYNKEQNIPGHVRFEALNSIYKNNENVRKYIVPDDGLPQHPDPNKSLDEFYNIWVPLVYKNVKELDVVFTSEDYGDEFAKYLGVEHFLVDKDRKKYPISGTKIRDNIFDNWDYLPEEIRPFFIKRISIMGPESCGKSTLTERLSNYFNTNFVLEYGRIVYESKNGELNINDFRTISEGRQDLEDWLIKKSNKLIFCDTEDITTYIFSQLFFPNEYLKVKKYFDNIIEKKPKYDIYILLKPDCDSIQDGTRKFLDDRWKHYQIIKDNLIERECNFVEIGGDWENRFSQSKKVISELL